MQGMKPLLYALCLSSVGISGAVLAQIPKKPITKPKPALAAKKAPAKPAAVKKAAVKAPAKAGKTATKPGAQQLHGLSY